MIGATELSHYPWGRDRRHTLLESLWTAHLVIFSKFKYIQTLCYAGLLHFSRGHNIRMFTTVFMLILKTWKQFKCLSTGGEGDKLCYLLSVKHRSVQFSRSVVSSSLWPHGLQHARLSLSVTNSQSLIKLMSIESVMPSNHLILCHPLLHLLSILPSIRVFSNESTLHMRWPKYWSFSFSNCPSNEYSGLTSFRIDWFDLLAVQGTLKSLLQHHSSKASILWWLVIWWFSQQSWFQLVLHRAQHSHDVLCIYVK